MVDPHFAADGHAALLGLMIATTFLIALLAAAPNPTADIPAVHVRATGAGQRCWVLLHPFGASGKFWERRAPLLAQAHGVRVYYPDLPSHGASAIASRFDYASATQWVASALRKDCPRPEMVVGASSGGIVAMKLAARTRARVAAIGVGHAFTPANLANLRESADAPSEGTLRWWYNSAEQGETQIFALRRASADLAWLGTGPLITRKEARALSGRLLVLNGDKDEFFLPASARALAAQVPGAKLHFFEGAGHLQPLAPPHATVAWQMIATFVRTGTLQSR